MSGHGSSSGGVFTPLVRLAAASAANPWRVIVVSAALLVLTALSLSRVTVSTSLEAMLGGRSESAVAFHRVVTEFEAGESLLAIVEGTRERDRQPTESELAAFADDFVETIRTHPSTRDRIAWVRCREDPAFAQYFAREVVPNGAYFLGAVGTREILARFDVDALDAQFARNEAVVASPGPAGEALTRSILRDPLRLHDVAGRHGLVRFDAPLPEASEPGAESPIEFSRDGKAVLVRIASKATINDLEEARRLTSDVQEIASDVARKHSQSGGPDIRVRLGGAYAISATSSGTIRNDSIVSTIVSVVLLYGLFVAFYRRWLTPLLIGVVAGVGMVVGFGVHAIGAPTVSPLATAVAALLAGLGVDYGIHFVSHFDEERARGLSSQDAATHAARTMALPITTNCFTSIFGFASLWPSPIEMLSDFATLGAVGLIGACLAAFTLLPALLVLTHRSADATRAAVSPRFGGVADAIAIRPRLWLSSSLALLAIAVGTATLRGQLPQIEGDLTVLHPQPNEALRTTEELVTRFAGQGEMIPVLVRVKDPADLVTRAIDAARALESDACRGVGVVDVLGVHRLLPDPRGVPGVDEVLQGVQAKELVDRFRAAVDRSAFDIAHYERYATFLERLLSPAKPPTMVDIAAYPSITQRLFPRDSLKTSREPTETLLVVRLEKPLRDRAARELVVSTMRRALANMPNATIAGLPAVSVELEDSTKEGLPQSIAISVCLVLCWLIIVFRRVMDVVLALVPLVFAAIFVVAFMVAIGEKFNPINSIAIPLLDGIAVDAGVFLVSVARDVSARNGTRELLVAELRPTMRAVLLAVATTVTGFLSLTATHTPAIRSLGMVAAVGIFASLIGSMCVLVPWLLKRADAR